MCSYMDMFDVYLISSVAIYILVIKKMVFVTRYRNDFEHLQPEKISKKVAWSKWCENYTCFPVFFQFSSGIRSYHC